MIQSNLDAFKNQSKKNITNREEYFIMQIILTCLFPLFLGDLDMSTAVSLFDGYGIGWEVTKEKSFQHVFSHL